MDLTSNKRTEDWRSGELVTGSEIGNCATGLELIQGCMANYFWHDVRFYDAQGTPSSLIEVSKSRRCVLFVWMPWNCQECCRDI